MYIVPNFHVILLFLLNKLNYYRLQKKLLTNNVNNVILREVKRRIRHFRGRSNIFMRSTGIVRKVDELGRIVIPIELRRTLDIEIKDALEIYVNSEEIILKKYQPSCIFCGEVKDVENFKNKKICKSCLAALKNEV